MIPERPVVERRILAALEASPSRIPVLLGGCGTGRTTLLLRVRELLGRGLCQYADVERIATTPERFLRSLADSSPFPGRREWHGEGEATARQAFDRALAVFASARAANGAGATFLLDEVLELRTFENFPGLRAVVRELIDTLSRSDNRFVLSTRYVNRALRLLRDASARFEVIHVPELTPQEVRTLLSSADHPGHDHDDLPAAIQALGDGRPVYVRAIVDTLADMRRQGGGDPVSALAALLGTGGALTTHCRFRYELRLHRARGYGALKAILDVIAEDERLTLTEIAQRLRRTPGSTKDYLSWLEDVDLVSVQHKRYSFADPVLRLWVRLHCRPAPPEEADLIREVHTYALGRLPQPEPAMALAGVPDRVSDGRDRWGIIEID